MSCHVLKPPVRPSLHANPLQKHARTHSYGRPPPIPLNMVLTFSSMVQRLRLGCPRPVCRLLWKTFLVLQHLSFATDAGSLKKWLLYLLMMEINIHAQSLLSLRPITAMDVTVGSKCHFVLFCFCIYRFMCIGYKMADALKTHKMYGDEYNMTNIHLWLANRCISKKVIPAWDCLSCVALFRCTHIYIHMDTKHIDTDSARTLPRSGLSQRCVSCRIKDGHFLCCQFLELDNLDVD